MNHLKEKYEYRELSTNEKVMEFMGLAMFFLALLGFFLKVMFF